MKCEHIRTRRQGDTPFFPNMLNNGNVEVCLKEDVDEVIAELKTELEERKNAAIYIKLSAEKVLRDLLDCGLIKEWYFNGKFNVVLNVDDPHLKIAELKQKLHDAEMRADLAEAAETERKIDYDKLKEERRWRKCSDEMPQKYDDGDCFLIAVEHESTGCPKGYYVTIAELFDGSWSDDDGRDIDENSEYDLEDSIFCSQAPKGMKKGFYRSKVTHWMPLPEPPKEAK